MQVRNTLIVISFYCDATKYPTANILEASVSSWKSTPNSLSQC